MKEEEKQRKFHDALLKMMYPPPPSPPSAHVQEDDVNEDTDTINGLTDPPEEGSSLPSSGDDNAAGENGSSDEKLTRAQRKRVRHRKLKEASLQRRKIIGPLLPGSNDGGVEDEVNTAEDVRQNAPTNVSGEAVCCSRKNRLKQRRKAKNLANLNSSSNQN